MHETTPRDRLARLRALHEAACLRAPRCRRCMAAPA